MNLVKTLRARMEKASVGAPPPGPVGQFLAVAERRARHRRVLRLLLASAVILGTASATFALVPTLFPSSPRDSTDLRFGASPGEEEASPSGEECSPASFRPTYLPWLKPEEEVPEPEVRDGARSAVLWWSAEDRKGWNGAYVALVTEFDPAFGGPDYRHDFPPVEVRGTKGRLIWVGDPGVGEVALAWWEGQDPCSSYSLHLRADLPELEAERELERISDSLAN